MRTKCLRTIYLFYSLHIHNRQLVPHGVIHKLENETLCSVITVPVWSRRPGRACIAWWRCPGLPAVPWLDRNSADRTEGCLRSDGDYVCRRRDRERMERTLAVAAAAGMVAAAVVVVVAVGGMWALSRQFPRSSAPKRYRRTLKLAAYSWNEEDLLDLEKSSLLTRIIYIWRLVSMQSNEWTFRLLSYTLCIEGVPQPSSIRLSTHWGCGRGLQ